MAGLTEVLQKLKNGREHTYRGMGVYGANRKVYLFYYTPWAAKDTFRLAVSTDGFNFGKSELQPTVYNEAKKPVPPEHISSMSFSKQKKSHRLMYGVKKNVITSLHLASSNHLTQWITKGKVAGTIQPGVIIPSFTHEKKYVMICSLSGIQIGYSSDMINWSIKRNPLLNVKNFPAGLENLVVEAAFPTQKGILVVFHKKNSSGGKSVYMALLEQENPEAVIWISKKPLWETPAEWSAKGTYHVGTVLHEDKIIGYWGIREEAIWATVYTLLNAGIGRKKSDIKLQKSPKNPVLVPRKEYLWESSATFNPAALYENGKVHLVYRAIGDQFLSVLGYAASKDGVHFDERSECPIFYHQNPDPKSDPAHSVLYWSGGGFGGCEDPRLTKIGNKIFMTYVAYDGVSHPRVALTSILIDDFLNQRWLWERPVIISPPGVIDKNAVIFPEKIGGKYVIMHRIFPDILIDYVDHLNFDGTTFLEGKYRIKPREHMWDSRKVGAGAPPIKTPYGWLLIYHSVGEQDSGKYKIGAMLLDLSDPTIVLHRTNTPILEPTESYENDGFKSGVTYPCGAVVVNNELFVYYGGADMVVCTASAPLEAFLRELTEHEEGRLQPVRLTKITHT